RLVGDVRGYTAARYVLPLSIREWTLAADTGVSRAAWLAPRSHGFHRSFPRGTEFEILVEPADCENLHGFRMNRAQLQQTAALEQVTADSDKLGQKDAVKAVEGLRPQAQGELATALVED